MRISIFIDSNAWDVLFERRVDLCAELPFEEFSMNITREAEFEIANMPAEKRQYVEAVIKGKKVTTDTYFGFYNECLPREEQRVAGFDSGRFASEEELAIIRQEASAIGPNKRPTGLFKNEADVSLAARSAIAVVLTCDGKGVLRRAKKMRRGAVVDLKSWRSGTSLAEFIKTWLNVNH